MTQYVDVLEYLNAHIGVRLHFFVRSYSYGLLLHITDSPSAILVGPRKIYTSGATKLILTGADIKAFSVAYEELSQIKPTTNEKYEIEPEWVVTIYDIVKGYRYL